MTKRELSQLYWLHKEIEQQQEQLLRLESVATNCTSTISGTPGGGGYSDKIGNIVVKIDELKAKIEQNKQRCITEQMRLTDYINAIPDSLTRQIFRLHFIGCMAWPQIALIVGGGNTSESVRKRVYRYLN